MCSELLQWSELYKSVKIILMDKIIEKKKLKNADDRVNYVSCASLEGDYDFISETVA